LYWTPILGSPKPTSCPASLPASRSYKTCRATTLLIAAYRRVPLPRQLAVAGACIQGKPPRRRKYGPVMVRVVEHGRWVPRCEYAVRIGSTGAYSRGRATQGDKGHR
jgi:hypothetical protein